MNVTLFPFLEFESVCGGLRTKIVPIKQPENINEPEDKLDEESHCILTHEFDTVHWELNDDRRHFRLLNQGTVEYFPSFYAQPRFDHKLTQFDWNIHTNHYKPDYKYVQNLNQILSVHLKEMFYHLSEGEYSELDTFTLSSGFYNLSWIYPEQRRLMFIYMAHLLRRQTDLKNVILENCHLRHEDGFRMLLTLSLTVGTTVEKLFLWHFFVSGVMPLDIGYSENMNDPFILTSDLKRRVPEEEKMFIWHDYIMDEELFDLPHDYFHFFTIFLKSFSNLTTLYVNYCFVALGQGITLNLLSSVRNGKLRDLYLLCTKEDMPYNSGCRISTRAWFKAKQKCPQLKVHLVVKSVGPCYDDNVTLFQEEMPLTSYLLNTGLPVINYNRIKEPWFDCIIRAVIHKYSKTLRRLYIEVWHPRSRLDIMLVSCITKLPLLEELIYCGEFDKFDSIKEICTYLLNYPTRLKFLKLRVLEDPCNPQLYKDTAANIEKEFKNRLYDRGINFCLGTQVV